MLTGIDCDTHKEEKARGITINLGFSHIDLPNGESAGIIDVPGHRDFINTMISGACGIDMVILVIAADEGIMPQTTEHLNIISSLGIKQGIVALSKTDLVDDELIEIAKSEIIDFLKSSVLENAPIVPVSSASGNGKTELVDEITKIASSFKEPELSKKFTMYIDRLFTVKGHGSVVTGSVSYGKISVGDEVFLLPGNNGKYRIRSIERHGKSIDSVQKGDRAAINLIGLKKEDFIRGMLISNVNSEASTLVDAYITGFNTAPELGLWSDIIFLSGTYSSSAKMHLLDKEKLRAGENALVQIHLNKEFSCEIKDKFIYRNSSDDLSLGGGYIIDNQPLHHKRRKAELNHDLNKLAKDILADDNLSGNICRLISKEPIPFTSELLCEKLGISQNTLSSFIANDNENIICYDNYIYVFARFDNLFRSKLMNSLEEFHKKNFLLDSGADTIELTGKLGLGKSPIAKIYCEQLLQRLRFENKIDQVDKTWIIKGHKANIDNKTLSEIDWVEQEFLSLNEEKPVISEIEEKAATKGISSTKLRVYLSYLVGKSKLKIFDGEYIHNQIFENARNKLIIHLVNKPEGIGIPEYKEIIIGTKKFRGLLSDILETEKIIQFIKDSNNESRLIITKQGKEFFNANIL